jgi:glycosyltransferase involved in cell wall biosynthesis
VRLAFVSPLPPAPTGIADYAVDVLAALSGAHEIEVFHNRPHVERDRLPAGSRLRPAAKLLEAHRAQPYDVVVHQLGNGPEHGFQYALLPRLPGLVVLHDLVLHHARARAFLDAPEVQAYRANPADGEAREAAARAQRHYHDELAYSYPAQADLIFEAQLGSVGRLLPYAYPLCRLPLETARVVAAHNEFMVRAIEEEVPGAAAVRIPMPVERREVGAYPVAALRARYGFAHDDVVVGAFGLLTEEKEIATVAGAFSRAAAVFPRLRLLLVGPSPDPLALDDLLRRAGVRSRTVVTGRVPFWALFAHMEAADLVVHLRYPTARETSAALLRVLAQGRPTIVSDLEHLADIPAAAVARVDVTDEEGLVARALVELGQDLARRQRLGANARAFAAREHSPAACRAGYETAIAMAAAWPDPPARPWPPHWPRASAE